MANVQFTPPPTGAEATGEARRFMPSWARWLVSLYNFVIGLSNGSLEQQTAVAANYTARPVDDYLLVSSTCTVTLPLTTLQGFSGKKFTFVMTVSGETLTVAASGSQTINGAATATLSAQWGVLRLKALATGGWVAV